METKFKDECRQIRNRHDNFIHACLDKIAKMLGSEHLVFGNSDLWTENGEVFFRHNGSNERILLYSEDGWNTAEDIAHWADIVLDVKNCHSAGNKKYTINWNLK